MLMWLQQFEHTYCQPSLTVAMDMHAKQLSSSIVTEEAALVENCRVPIICTNSTIVQAIRHSYARNFACQQEHILLPTILIDINLREVCSWVTDTDLYKPTLSMTSKCPTNFNNTDIYIAYPPYACATRVAWVVCCWVITQISEGHDY